MVCSRCGHVTADASLYCPSCGVLTGSAPQLGDVNHDGIVQVSFPHGNALAKGRGFGQIFGIHPAIAFLTIVVDLMLFSVEIATLGAILPISLFSALVLGVIAFMAQRKWYGDDKESAFIKALILAFLTAIPSPLPAILYVPSGIVGLIHNFRRK